MKLVIRATALLAVLSAASMVQAKDDPYLFRPKATLGGQVGFGAGLALGTSVGGPKAGIAVGMSTMLIGHGLDRAVTRLQNDVTGPAWSRLEQSTFGNAVGNAAKGAGDAVEAARKKLLGR